MKKFIEPTKRHDQWDKLDWGSHNKHVRQIQEKIFRETQNKDWKKVKNLQKLLVHSHSARLVSIRAVTQINNGKSTPGIDNTLYLTSTSRFKLLTEIKNLNPMDYQCQPVKRAYIPKSNRKLRPLGIPTIKDRTMQYLIKLALEPEWEAKFEPNSYGFRPGRRTQDAIKQIWDSIRERKGKQTSEWILDADISGCFDNINHDSILKRVYVFKRIISRWLKAGVVELNQSFQTTKGTPQGGVISPLLANIALDGMEALFGIESKTGRYLTPSSRGGDNKGISLIRYADDFVVTAPSETILINYVIPKLKSFLSERGLSLNQMKTRVVHRTEGFNFLGFHIRQYSNKKQTICLIQPSKSSVKRILKKIKRQLSFNKQATQQDIIKILNPIIRGWCNYYRYSNAKQIFSYIDYRVWKMIWFWCCRRHSQKGKKWIKNKYFPIVDHRKWVFNTGIDSQLLKAASIKVSARYYVKVKGYASPFDPALRQYWNDRFNIKCEIT